jgi:hypothetical protein
MKSERAIRRRIRNLEKAMEIDRKEGKLDLVNVYKIKIKTLEEVLERKI